VAEAAPETIVMKAHVHVADEYESDSDREDDRLQHWCGDDVFSQRGKRSVFMKVQDELACTPGSSTMPNSEIGGYVRDDSCVLVAADINANSLEFEEPAGKSKLKRKQVSGPDIVDIGNHT
jgi:hypothetical protein